MKKIMLLVMGVLALSFLTNTDSQKARAFFEINSPLISESENNLISPTDLRSIKVERYKYFHLPDYPLGPPNRVWHEENYNGVKMVGYLSFDRATGRYQEFIYKGTLYNANYPIPLDIIELNQ